MESFSSFYMTIVVVAGLVGLLGGVFMGVLIKCKIEKRQRTYI